MPLHDFGNSFVPLDTPPQSTHLPGIQQLSDVQSGRVKGFSDSVGTNPDYVEEFVTPGFRYLDEAMKNYWSGIRVPTKDAYRFMRTKIAGGDKSVLIWNDGLQGGRVRLPVASINRLSYDFNPDKFSPPYLAMTKRYTSNRMDRVALVYRPVPYLVEYEMIIWSEFKRDIDTILYQITTRFNPLAEFTMYDQHLVGNVQLRFGGASDSSDKETGHDQKANVRYELRMTAEAWLPLPERIVPTILGHSTVLREKIGDIFLASLGNYNKFYEPIQTKGD